jgi:Tfp pilus assembly protein PilN
MGGNPDPLQHAQAVRLLLLTWVLVGLALADDAAGGRLPARSSTRQRQINVALPAARR